jgi:DNA-binding GntR family transcriptional regulator
MIASRESSSNVAKRERGTAKRHHTSSVVDIIRQKIVSGDFGGDLVREEALAADLGLGRTPVREAIQILIGQGLLLKEHSKSARVFRPSLADLQDIYTIRMQLEGLAARGAAESGPRELPDELDDLLRDLAKAEPGLAYSLCHEAFHVHLIQAGNSARLASIIRNLRAQSEPYVRLALQASPDFVENATRQHRHIVQAVQARDADLAEKLVSDHLRESMERIPRILSLGVTQA